MTDAAETLASRVRERFGSRIASCRAVEDEVTAELAPGDLLEVARALRDEPGFAFEQLTDVCGVDYAAYGKADWETDGATSTGFSRGVGSNQYVDQAFERGRFAAVYHLLSLSHNRRIRLRVFLDEIPRVPSVVDLWSSANWFEREAFDLVGILFDGHPDLRRILTDYGFVGHPFRKDFPVSGNVEVRYDPDRGRVVYQPVSIEPRTLVPKVIRHDHRFESGEGAKEDADA